MQFVKINLLDKINQEQNKDSLKLKYSSYILTSIKAIYNIEQ